MKYQILNLREQKNSNLLNILKPFHKSSLFKFDRVIGTLVYDLKKHDVIEFNVLYADWYLDKAVMEYSKDFPGVKDLYSTKGLKWAAETKNLNTIDSDNDQLFLEKNPMHRSSQVIVAPYFILGLNITSLEIEANPEFGDPASVYMQLYTSMD